MSRLRPVIGNYTGVTCRFGIYTGLVSCPAKQRMGYMTALSDLLDSLNREQWSSREIAERAAKRGVSVSHTAIARYMAGNHPVRVSAKMLAAFAVAFGVDVNKLREAANAPDVHERFELPPEADMLNPDERQAVVNLVRVMARGKERPATPQEEHLRDIRKQQQKDSEQ